MDAEWMSEGAWMNLESWKFGIWKFGSFICVDSFSEVSIEGVSLFYDFYLFFEFL